MGDAKFSVNGIAWDDDEPGVDVTDGALLTIALTSTVDVTTWKVSVELRTKNAAGETVTLAPASGQASTPVSNVTVQLPSIPDEAHSYLIRVTVNNGRDASGILVENFVRERIVAVLRNGNRSPLFGERGQYDRLHGWSPVIEALINSTGGGGGGSPESTTATPSTLALRTAGSRIAASGFDGGNLFAAADLELDAVGDLTVGAATATGLTVGNSGALCQLIGSSFVCSADTVSSQPTSGSTVLTTTVALAYQELFAAGITSVTRGFTQRASGAGAVHRIEGQRGAAGSIGGAVQIASGKGGTSGTNQAGGVRIELGAQATGATDYLHVSEDSSNFLGIRRIGTTAYIESLSSGLTLTSPSDIGFNATTNGVFRCATAFFDQGTIYWRTAASAIRRIDTVAAAYVQAYDAAVTSLTETLVLASAVRSKTWTDGSTAARVDEYHASVTTTDATVTNCGTVTITNNQVAHVTVEVCGYSGTTLAASYERKATFRATGGTATLIGSVTSVHTAEDAAGWDCTLDASGATARVRVTGAAATTIRWEAKIRVTWSK